MEPTVSGAASTYRAKRRREDAGSEMDKEEEDDAGSETDEEERDEAEAYGYCTTCKLSYKSRSSFYRHIRWCSGQLGSPDDSDAEDRQQQVEGLGNGDNEFDDADADFEGAGLEPEAVPPRPTGEARLPPLLIWPYTMW